MDKNQKINKVDLIFDNSNGTPILSNKNDVLNTLKQNETTQNKTTEIPFVSIKEINDMDVANQWLRPIDYLAILENNDDKELSDYVKNLEKKSEQLYHDLNKIVIDKYNIKDQELIKKITNLNAKNDPIIGQHLDLVDDVIYNVEADWNDALNLENKLDLYNVELQTTKANVSNLPINAETKFNEISMNDLRLVEVVANNSNKVDTKELKTTLEQKSSEELYNYINDITTKIKFVEEIRKDLIDFYQIISSKKEVKNAKKLSHIFKNLEKNSETVERVINSVDANDDFDVREMFDESFDALDSIEEQLNKISKYVKLDEELSNLNEEIITLHKTLDVLTTKLSVAYAVAFDNENKFSKRLIKRNRELEKKAIEVTENSKNVEMVESNHFANSESYDEMIQKINDETSIVLDEKFNLFASKKQTSKFRKLLDQNLKRLMKLNNTNFTTLDAKDYVMNEYFLFLNSELGIVNDLVDLVGLIELQRIKLMGEIAKIELSFLNQTNLSEKIEFSLRTNFEMTKILASEILVLKAILLHRDVIAVVKAQAKKQCQDLITVIAWDRRLNWWIDTTKEVISEAYFHPVYGQDEGVQYLFNEINKLDEEIEDDCDCECCEDDCEDDEECSSCCGGHDSCEEKQPISKSEVQKETTQPTVKTKTMVMKFLETKYVNIAEPTKTMVMKFVSTEKVDVIKPVRVVEYHFIPTTDARVQTVTQVVEKVIEKPVEVEAITNKEKEIKVVTYIFEKQTEPVIEETPVVEEVVEPTKVEDARLRRLSKRGMSSAAFRIAELVKETRRELTKETARIEKEKQQNESNKK